MKHLFETDGVAFIIATDTEQLSESVRAVYGANFDSRRYLRRFFDRTYRFRDPDYDSYVEYLFERSGIGRGRLRCPQDIQPPVLASAMFKDFSASLREAEQCIDMLHTFCTMWNKELPIELGYALAMICLYHAGRIDDYLAVSGRTDVAAGAVFQRPSVIMTNVIGGMFQDRRREITATTEDLVKAYVGANKRSLLQSAQTDTPENPAERYVLQTAQNEFSVLHNNQYATGRPPFSILKTYHRYVELADRLSDAEGP